MRAYDLDQVSVDPSGIMALHSGTPSLEPYVQLLERWHDAQLYALSLNRDQYEYALRGGGGSAFRAAAVAPKPAATPQIPGEQPTGRLLVPIDGGRIGSEFGMRYHPILQKPRLHKGVDIGAAAGTPIMAAERGTVVRAGWRGGYGNALEIAHGGGLTTLYAHCSLLLVGEGAVVERGQVIAKAGSTGLSTGPHLHFEVRINGKPVDPRTYL